ncbi:MAG: CheR family methyltransferase [Leptolyngbya sp. BL-A-14]
MALDHITALLSKRIGVDTRILGDRALGRAIDRRRSACGARNLEAYLALLQAVPSEFDALVEQIVIPETWFFRDRKPFDFLVDFARSEWLLKPSNQHLRVLSVPCATGEEPYSIAIALLEAGLTVNRFSIDAIDLSHQAIAKAQKATYGEHSFRGKDWVERHRYFQAVADQYTVCPRVRHVVNFRQGNLLDVFAGNSLQYDIIFCRNLLIYIEQTRCHRILETLHHLLVPDGLLFVGAAETGKVPSDRFSSLRQSFTFAYRKISSPSAQRTEADLRHPNVEASYSKVALPLAAKRSTGPRPKHSQLPLPKERSIRPPRTHKASLSMLQQAKTLADAGQLSAAIACCNVYLEQHCTDADAYILLGTLYQAITDDAHGERCFQKALYLQPNHDEALLHLALLKESRGDASRAARLRQRIQKLQQPS